MSHRKARKYPPKDYVNPDTTAVENSLQAIEGELKMLTNHKVWSMHSSISKQLVLQLLRGIFFGLGTAMGATIVLSGLLFLLAQINTKRVSHNV